MGIIMHAHGFIRGVEQLAGIRHALRAISATCVILTVLVEIHSSDGPAVADAFILWS